MPDRRKLRVGDRIRIVSVPTEDLKQAKREKNESELAGHTAQVIQEIVDSKKVVEIFQIDEFKQPWVIIKFKRKGGRIEMHSLAIMEDDSWVFVPSPQTSV
jgi:hypothetical protein